MFWAEYGLGVTVATAAMLVSGGASLEATGSGVAAKTVSQVLRGPIADEVPGTIAQQLALGAAKGELGTIIMKELGDANRLIANYGPGEWVKVQYVLRGNESNVVVHYFRNLTTLLEREFKFK